MYWLFFSQKNKNSFKISFCHEKIISQKLKKYSLKLCAAWRRRPRPVVRVLRVTKAAAVHLKFEYLEKIY
jgi:hypothetical protein